MSQGHGLISSSEPLILIGEQDDSFRAFLEYVLKKSGFDVLSARDGRALIECIAEQTPDVILFESPLPGIEAGELCSRLRVERRTREAAILILTNGDSEENYVEMLRCGADDCIARPYSPEKLIARIQAALRGAVRPQDADVDAMLHFADLEVDLAAHRVRRSGRDIHLTPTGFRLLRHFLRNRRRVCSRSELQAAAWPQRVHVGPRTVDVHVANLRNTLKEAGGPDLIRTVRSFGYSLSD